MQTDRKYVQIHRHRDHVALYVEGNKTIYLAPEDAEQIGDALIDCSLDTVTNKFSESEFETFRLNEDLQS